MTDPRPHRPLDGLPLFASPAPQPVHPPARHAAPPSWGLAGPANGTTSGPAQPPTSPPPAAPAAAARPRPSMREAGDRIDWALVRAFRQQAADRLAAALAERDGLDEAGRHELGRSIVLTLLSSHADSELASGAETFTAHEQQILAAAIFDSLFGLGRLQPLVDNPDVENVEIYGCDSLLEYADGHLEIGPQVADSDEELIETLAFLASRTGSNDRPFSPANPDLHLRLDGGARLAASAWITPRPAVVIRRHRLRRVSLDDLVARHMMDPALASLLAAAVRAKRSIVVSGPQGAGKTTLIRALCAQLDPWERIGTLETEYELHLDEMPDRHRRMVPWEARPGSGERGPDGKAAGEITLDEIVYSSFRYNLSRLIVGEVRGKEILAMFKVMQGGAGSMSTTHAYSARAAIERLVTCAMEAGAHVTEQFAYRQVAEHIDLIVQIGMDSVSRPDGTPHRVRYITEVIAVEPGDGSQPAVTHVYRPGPGGRAVPGVLPAHLHRLTEFGFDATAFNGARP